MIEVDPAREEAELREYLGERYDRSRLERSELEMEEELARIGDEQRLYRESEAYLYNLTAFAMTRIKEPYLQEVARAVQPPARILDYGCGIGSDGLLLAEAGYRVAFADFDNPSTRYLRWRLERRNLDARVYDLDADPPPGAFDLAFAFDVIEHVAAHFAFLGELERRARLVLVNFLVTDERETELHRALPVRDLLRHAAGRGLRRYRIFDGRSHLVLYEPRASSRLPVAVTLAAARLRSR